MTRQELTADLKAHWIPRDYYRESSECYDVHMYVCSSCRHEYSYDSETGWSAEDYNYCPSCGASMQGD